MSLVNMKEILERAHAGKYAVGAFCYFNAETAQAIAEKGSELRSPIILIAGPWEIPLLGAKMTVEIAKWVAASADVPVCLHLDHAKEIDIVKECIDAGFPSVMIDASDREFEDNIRLTRQVVEIAHAKGITVEGELGAVGRIGETTVEGSAVASLTDPAEAAEFVERTGIDALASAIGNAHGIYTQRPVLDFDRLEAIRKATGVPLVLHGGSGTATDQLHRAIEIGISKVNVASELGRAFLDGVERADEAKEGKVWLSHALAEGKAAVAERTGWWMNTLGSAGRIA